MIVRFSHFITGSDCPDRRHSRLWRDF